MSVFGFIKRGRQAAKEHNAKKAEKQKAEAQSAPYRHVPTHAAVDALSGAPPSWRQDDRPRILEQNRRRSAMAASGMSTTAHMGIPGFHRTSSSLSHVSFPAAYANPVVSVPRTYSYGGVNPAWQERGNGVVYSHGDQSGTSLKGKEVERPIAALESGVASRIPSQAASPVASSGNSTSSQDDLEIRPARQSAQSRPPNSSRTATIRPPGGGDAATSPSSHRLHPSNRRRFSDASVTDQEVSQPKPSAPPPRPAPQARNSIASASSPGIPPVPALPPLQFTSSAFSTSPEPSPSSSVPGIATAVSTPSPVLSFPNGAPRESFAPAYAQAPTTTQNEPSFSWSEGSAGTAVTTPEECYTTKPFLNYSRFNETDMPRSTIHDGFNFTNEPRTVVARVPTTAEIDQATSRQSVIVPLPNAEEPAVPPTKAKRLSKNSERKLLKRIRK